jgi:hypothetical protein
MKKALILIIIVLSFLHVTEPKKKYKKKVIYKHSRLKTVFGGKGA